MARSTASPGPEPIDPATSPDTESLSAAADPVNDAAQASQPQPPTLVDEFYGHGGTYIVDPVTGIRERIAP